MSWNARRQRKAERLAAAIPFAHGRILAPETIVQALETLIRSGDRVAIEGNNQKQADFLSRSLAQVDPGKVNNLHLLISSVSRSEHLDLFESGIARLIPIYFVPYCWNKSPITQQNPPTNGQNNMVRARCSCVTT